MYYKVLNSGIYFDDDVVVDVDVVMVNIFIRPNRVFNARNNQKKRKAKKKGK